MQYLLLGILCSGLIAVMMRISESRVRNNISELAVNYAVCLFLSSFYVLGPGGGAASLARAAAGGNTLALGLVSGAFYVGSFLLYQYNISRNGVVLPATFMKLGVLVPVLLAIIVFGEKPGVLQVAGIAIALTAIMTLNRPAGTGDTVGAASVASAVRAPRALLLLVLIGGAGDAMSKVYEELGDAALKSQYLTFTFISALVLCSLTAVVKGQRLAGADVLYGCLIGIPNYYSARFLLLSLSYVPAATAYPTFSVGTILLVTAAGVLVFKERMTKRQWLAMGMILVALVLLNW